MPSHIYFSHYFANVKVYSYDSLPTGKILALNNVIMLIKLVLNKDENHYYYNTFHKNVHIN